MHPTMQLWDIASVDGATFVDSAAPGQASLDLVFLRALKAEATVPLGGAVVRLFWDLKGFYDSIDLSLLIDECCLSEFPLDILFFLLLFCI